MDIAVSVLLQCPIALAKDEAGEDDARIACGTGAQILNILVGVRRIADDQEFMPGLHPLERFDHQMRVVLRLKPRNV